MNDSFTLNCTDTVGNPPPLFTWFRDDTNITSSPQYTVTNPTDRISILSVNGVQPEEAGTYKCSANNGVGKDTTEAVVMIRCK